MDAGIAFLYGLYIIFLNSFIKMKTRFKVLLSGILILMVSGAAAQAGVQVHGKSVALLYGNMDGWITRTFKESGIIGGNVKTLYEVGKTRKVEGSVAYVNSESPWATSNVYARVSGITKGSNSVFPERRGNGYAARLETRLEQVVVLGIINLKVVATGSLYLGQTQEPVTDTKDPNMKLMQGVPFSKQIKALRFDYKTITGGKQIKATGFGSPTRLNSINSSEVVLLLQKRWEKDGRIFAKRIGTAYVRFDKTVSEWVDNYTIPVEYGNITRKAGYKPYMGLQRVGQMYSKNSQGNMVPVEEIGWGEPSEGITHMTLRFSAGNGGAYVGAPGNTLWVDNVELVE